MGRNLSVIIVPHDNAKTRNYSVSYSLLYTFFVLVFILMLVIIFFVASYGRVMMKAQSAVRLEKENRWLLAQTAKIDSLEHELVKLQALSIQIKKMMGINLTPSDSALVAKLSDIVKYPPIADEQEAMDVGKEEQKRMLRAVPSMWPVKGYVTREFHTTGGEKSADYHPGIDIAAKRNTPIVAPADGVVVTSTWDDTYGYMTVIDHGFGIYTVCAHNSRNLVKEGERVVKGQTIAFVGSTGKSSAPHLHFEVRKNGLPVNPGDYLLR